LSDVNFFFFVDVTQKIDQRADKENHATPNRPPHVMRPCGVTAIYEKVKPVNSISQRAQAYDYCQDVFHAFHFEPPANGCYEGCDKAGASIGLHVNASPADKARLNKQGCR
jgi:hypothetical protein